MRHQGWDPGSRCSVTAGLRGGEPGGRGRAASPAPRAEKKGVDPLLTALRQWSSVPTGPGKHRRLPAPSAGAPRGSPSLPLHALLPSPSSEQPLTCQSRKHCHCFQGQLRERAENETAVTPHSSRAPPQFPAPASCAPRAASCFRPPSSIAHPAPSQGPGQRATGLHAAPPSRKGVLSSSQNRGAPHEPHVHSPIIHKPNPRNHGPCQPRRNQTPETRGPASPRRTPSTGACRPRRRRAPAGTGGSFRLRLSL